jgi:hypothetical protein
MSTSMSLKVLASSHLPAPDDDLDLTIRSSDCLDIGVPAADSHWSTHTSISLSRGTTWT